MKRAALWLLVCLPLVLGILAGLLVRLSVIIVRAVTQGYLIGRGEV